MTKRKVMLASGNKGKLKELQNILKSLNVTLLPQPQSSLYEVEETGTTFVENAIIKARHASALSGLPCIADDSGLMVDALDGLPGVRTARYAGEGCGSSGNMQLLLKNLRHLSEIEQRAATFVCVLVYIQSESDPLPIIATGMWRGFIYPEQKGKEGFGYDPVFWDDQYLMTAAEMNADLKSRLSHRGQACASLLQQLKNKWLH